MTADASPSCRRCSECDGDHHWLEDCPENTGPRFICKHCDATTEAVECSRCEFMVPAAEAKQADGGRWVCDWCTEGQARS